MQQCGLRLCAEGVGEQSSYRLLDVPGAGRGPELQGAVRKEADLALAARTLCTHLRPVLGRMQIPLVYSMCIRALRPL